MKLHQTLLAALLLACPGGDGFAQVVYSVNIVGLYQFPFPPGANLPGQIEPNGMTWAAAGPAGPPITIASNSLPVPGLASPVGHRARLAGMNGPAARIGLDTNVNSGTIYYSLALRVADLGMLGTNGGVLAALNNATGASSNLPAPLAAGLGIRSSGNGYQLGVSAISGATGNFWDYDWWWCVYPPTQTVFVVCSYTFMPGPSNDVARLWLDINPATFGSSNAPPPDSVAISTNDMNQISSFVLMQRPHPILPAVAFLDEVRVGLTWASVTPPATADLAVNIGTLPPQLQEGELLPVLITVSNRGPDVATGVQLTFTIPTGAVLQTVTNDHGPVTVQGSNVTCSVAMLAPQQSFNVQAVFSANPQFAGQTGPESYPWNFSPSASATEADPNSTNNLAVAVVLVFPNLDFGDARLPYPVTRVENGARHRNGSVYHMGANYDREANGVHSALADADDLAGVPSDEDGVVLPAGPLVAGHTNTVTVNVPVAGFLDSFFDFNNDRDWNDPGERVTPLGGLAIGPGAIPVPVAVPLSAVTGSPHARFRFSDVGGLMPTGFHPVGEVVDRQVEIRRMDFGSAPDPNYPTLLASDGARHVVDPAIRLGATIDAEGDAFDTADGDGVVFLTPLTPGTVATVQVTASVAGLLDAFIDFNGDGVWTERITAVGGTPLVAGVNLVNFTVPTAATPKATWSRFRFSTVGGLGPNGPANDGEAEDYPVTILPSPVVIFGGLEHSRLGMASQLVSSNGLMISNLASSNDAVRIALGEAEGWRGDIGQLTLANGPLNVALRGSVGGQTNRLVDSMSIERSGSNVLFSPNFAPLGATQYTARVYDSSGTLLLSRAPTSAPFSVYAPCFDEAGNLGRLVCRTEVRFDSIAILVCECFGIAGLPPNTPGPVEIVFTPSDSISIPDFPGLPAVEISGPSASSLTLSGEALRQGGLWHQAVGDAHFVGALNELGEYLAISNLGTNGTDGIATEFGKQAIVDVRIPNCPCEPNPSCCSTTAVAFRLVLSGTMNGMPAEMAYVTFVGEVPQGHLYGNFAGSGAASATLEVRNGTQLVGSIPVGNGDWGTFTGTSNQPVSLNYGSFVKVDSNRVNLVMQFNYPITFNAQAGGSFVGNNLRLRIANPNAVLNARVGALTIRGPAPASILNSIQDFGDAPDPNYPTKAISEGARHRFSLASAYGPYLGPWYLGTRRDAEPDAHANADATGDDITSYDDEDGVSGITGFTEGTTVTVTATASRGGYLDGWIDYNGNGTWEDSEKVFPSVHLDAGANTLTFTAQDYEDSVFLGLRTFARFRFSKDGGLGPTGPAATGEVEDYQVFIAPKSLFFAGLGHGALGNAALTAASNQLRVANIGSSGLDGVSIELGRVDGWQGRIEAPLRPAQAGNGSKLNWSLLGTVNVTSNQPAAAGRMEVINGDVNVFADFSAVGATSNLVQAFASNQVVASAVVPATAPAFRFVNGGWPPSLVIAWRKPIPVGEPLTAELTWNTGSPTCYVAIANGPVIAPDIVTVTPVNAIAQVQNLSKLNFLGQWPSGDLTIRDEAIALLGQWHRGVGGAFIGTTDTNALELRVSNLGSSGEDGIETIVGGTEFTPFAGNTYRQRIVQAWPDDWTMPWLTASNSHVRWTATGRITGSAVSYEKLEDLLAFKQEQGTALTADFTALGATQSQVDVFDGLAHRGSFTLPGLGKITASTGGVARVTAAITDGTVVWTLKWDTRSAFTPSNGVPLIGDRLRIAAVNPTMMVEGLRSLITRGANVELFALRGFNTATPQRPRLSTPRLLPGGGPELPIPTEPDVTYDIERSANVNGPWTRIGTVIGTDGMSTTSFFDVFVSDEVFYRIRVR